MIFNPGKPTFKVTAKDESIAEARLSEISRPFFVIFGLLVVAMIFAVWRIYSEPYKADVTLVVGGWNLLNLIFAGCALGVVSERGDKSASRRITVKRRCEVKLEGSDTWVPASIDNVSVHGLLINLFDNATTVQKGETAIVRVKPHSEGVPETMPLNIVRTVRGEGFISIGCTFSPQRAVDHRLIADLIFANSEQWSEFQRVRRRNPGLIRGTATFLAISLFQTQRGLFYLARALRPGSKAVKPAGAVK